jgi:uncharacterized protein (TIGR02996 family)
MPRQAKPSQFRQQLAVLLDDNVNVPVPAALAFEQALREDPNDRATRQAYQDWLLEQGCPTRAEEVALGVLDPTAGEYTGAVRPEGYHQAGDWADF